MISTIAHNLTRKCKVGQNTFWHTVLGLKWRQKMFNCTFSRCLPLASWCQRYKTYFFSAPAKRPSKLERLSQASFSSLEQGLCLWSGADPSTLKLLDWVDVRANRLKKLGLDKRSSLFNFFVSDKRKKRFYNWAQYYKKFTSIIF